MPRTTRPPAAMAAIATAVAALGALVIGVPLADPELFGDGPGLARQATGGSRVRETPAPRGSLPSPPGSTPTPSVPSPSLSAPFPSFNARSAAGRILLHDSFESIAHDAWSSVRRDGDATVSMDRTTAHSGAASIRLHVTEQRRSRANLALRLPPGTAVVRLDGWFSVAGEGEAGSNVPLFRLFTGELRVVDLYRQNGEGRLWLRANDGSGGWDYIKLRRALGLRQWHHVVMTTRAAGRASTVIVRVDGEEIFRGPVPLVRSVFTDAMIGSEHVQQEMELNVDDVLISVPDTSRVR